MSFELTQEEIKALVESGGMAPSGGNMQPWKITVYKNRIELQLAAPHEMVMLDIRQFGSYFALGAFYENVSVAADMLGLVFETNVVQSKDANQLSVDLVFTGRKNKSENSLYQYISQRETNRQISDGTIIARSIIDSLINETSKFNTHFKLTCVSQFDQKEKFVNILGKADGIRMLNDTLYNEMFHEIRWDKESTEKTKNGIDIISMELPGNAAKLFGLLYRYPFIRNILPRKTFEDMAKPLLMHSSHIACLSMKVKLTPETMFTAGQVMEHVWLLSTKLGLAIHPWTVLTFFLMRVEYFGGEGFSQQEKEELTVLRHELLKCLNLAGDELPVFIFRLSIAKKPSARALRYSWNNYTILKR